MIDTISKSLEQVWKWKEEVYNDTKNMTFEEKKKYSEKNLKESAELIGAKLVKNEDGTFKFENWGFTEIKS